MNHAGQFLGLSPGYENSVPSIVCVLYHYNQEVYFSTGLKPEIEGEFESNYRKNIVKSLKKVRQEITRMYVSIEMLVAMDI
jgi:hypothetical protein